MGSMGVSVQVMIHPLSLDLLQSQPQTLTFLGIRTRRQMSHGAPHPAQLSLVRREARSEVVLSAAKRTFAESIQT